VGTEGRPGEISCAVTSSISLGKKVGKREGEIGKSLRSIGPTARRGKRIEKIE